MNEFWTKVIINIIIGIIVFGGFFAFWCKSAGLLKEGGLLYEYIKKNKKSKKKTSNKSHKKD